MRNPRPSDDAPLRRDGPVYGYRPNLMGSPWVFRLKDATASRGNTAGARRCCATTRCAGPRLSYRPATMQTHRFITEIWGEQSPKLQISSTSFRGLMEQQRQDARYAAFVGELHRRLAAAGSAVRFEAG